MIPNLPSLPLTEADWLFAALMLLVLVVPLVAERLRVPSIVGLVCAGALVGPGGLGILTRAGPVGALGTVGLLYLMFLAGLELDLDDFSENRAASLVFGGLTFAIPMVLGVTSTLLLGFGVLASILVASCWASHTLLTYPVFRRFGTAAHPAVATAVGGTIITDTAALVVLVVVAGAYTGALSATFWLSLVAGMAALGVLSLVVLPRLGRWFFATFAHEVGVRFAFVLAALFGASALASLVGLEAIIGAFLAGLALNRLVPNASRLMDRIEFLGSNLFVPIFLLSVGLLIDFRLLAEPRTLLLAVVFTAVAMLSKALAAAAAGWVLRYDRREVAAVFSLSNAQAAATLAAIVVGLRVGLIGTEVVNAVVMVILVTCLLSSAVAGRVAPSLVRAVRRRSLGTTVVLPVVRPESAEPLARLASAMARADGGAVVPVTIAAGEIDAEGLTALRAVNARVEQMVRATGVEADGVVRIDASAAAGVLNVAREHEASLLIMGWQGPDHSAVFAGGGNANPIVAATSAPVLLARLDDRPVRRLLLLLPHVDDTPVGEAALRLAIEVVRRARSLHRAEVRVITCGIEHPAAALVEEYLDVAVERSPRPGTVLAAELAGPDDLLVVPVRSLDVQLRGAERLNRAAGTSQIVAAVGGVGIPYEPLGGRDLRLAPLR